MKMLCLGLINYETVRGALPKQAGAFGKDETACSWRVAILPELDQQETFDRYNFGEPWNGPSNSKILPLDSFCSPRFHSTETIYFAITGPQTAWGDNEPLRISEIQDGADKTMLLIEAAGRGVHWAEPKDLTFDEALELLTTPLPGDGSDGHRIDRGYFHKPEHVRHVAMCDGSCTKLRVPLPREVAVALLTAKGGEEIDPKWLEYYTEPQLDYGKVWGFSFFVIIALLPGIPAARRQIWPNITAAQSVAEDTVSESSATAV